MSKTWFFLIAGWLIGFASVSCQKNSAGSEGSALPVPKFVSKTPDTAFVEHGIDAIPEADAIFLEWYSPRDSRIAATRIFRLTPGNKAFRQIAEVAVPETTYVDFDVAIQERYSYYLAFAGKSDLGLSATSDTVHYSLLPKPFDLRVSLGVRPTFSWQYSETPPPGYLIRVESRDGDQLLWLTQVVSYDSFIRIGYNFDNSAPVDSLDRRVGFRWRVDVLGTDLFSGSESNWEYVITDQ